MGEVKVRIGTPEDVHNVMSLVEAAYEDNGITGADKIKILHEVWSALNLHHGVVGIIGEPGQELEAGVLLRTQEMWYSSNPSLIERIIFVNPKYRNAKGGRAAKLMDFAKEMAIELNLPLVIGIITSNRTEAKIRMYKRHLGEPSGAFWVWNGKIGSEKEQLTTDK
jgi:hypothetical protein